MKRCSNSQLWATNASAIGSSKISENRGIRAIDSRAVEVCLGEVVDRHRFWWNAVDRPEELRTWRTSGGVIFFTATSTQPTSITSEEARGQSSL
jgi:hypothetical protein